MQTWRYALIVFLGGCCYGALSTVVKLAYAAGFSPSEVSGIQYTFGTLLCWFFYALSSNRQKLGWRRGFKLLALGLPFGLTGILYYQSLQTLDASLAIIFLFQFVWVGTLLDWLFNKNRPTPKKLLSILILLAGSVLATDAFSRSGARFSFEGAAWALLAALTFASFIFISSAVERSVSPLQKSAYFCLGGSVVVWLLLRPISLLDPVTVVQLAPYGAFLGLVGVVLPPILFAIGMPYVGPGLGTMLTASELPVAITLSALILAERVNLVQWGGVLAILTGILVANISLKRRVTLESAQGG